MAPLIRNLGIEWRRVWCSLELVRTFLRRIHDFATAGIRTPNLPVCSQVTKPTERTSTRRENYIVPSYMEDGTDGHELTVLSSYMYL